MEVGVERGQEAERRNWVRVTSVIQWIVEAEL
jgi:hypothetical protein